MTNWKDTLRTEHGEMVAQASLNLLQANGPVQIYFGGATELTPTIQEAVNALLIKLPSMESDIAEATFSSYEEMLAQYGDEDGFPVAANSVALKPFYQLTAIYLPEEPEEGRFGLGFECEWEIEHGLGLQFRNWQIVETGGAAEAFSFYD